MLNKILLIFFVAAANIFSQNLLGTKIYINPGHGGHDSNDRYIAATGFWESDGNLGKGLALRDILNQYNASIKMSRTTNTSADDLGLSVIAADANNFDADYFHSIHSNGFNGQSNYTLILFQGGDNAPTYPESKIMGALLGTEIKKAHRTTAKYNRGDFDFYGTGQAYLGVFKGLIMPGTLSEGSFHDYIPESWRLRNESYLQHEAWAIAKSFVQYFNQPQFSFGEIAGIVRDPFLIVDYFYIASTGDRNKPVNNIKITLLPNNEVYDGDFYNNGFFLFDNLDPGDYQLVFEVNESRNDTLNVTVQAGETTFADKYYSDSNPRSELAFLSSFPINNSVDISSTVKIKIKLDGPISFSTLGGRVSFTDKDNNSVSLKSFDETNYEGGWIIFEPAEPLENLAEYKVKISKGVEDIYGFDLKNDIEINFTVEEASGISGDLITSFEEISSWQQPQESITTIGIDVDNTSLLFSSNKSVDGDNSARLVYLFDSDSNGVCRINNTTGFNLSASANGVFGLWVFGDATNNILEYGFKDAQGTATNVFVDSLNWTGWKFKEVELTDYADKIFNSIVIKQSRIGEKGGQLYFDKAMTNSSVTDIPEISLGLPKSISLEQNYPNPFNPSTTISYSISKSDFVTLKVYDLLGRNIENLVQEYKSAGFYNVSFDASDFSSGVYYYTLQVGSFITTKKMIVMK